MPFNAIKCALEYVKFLLIERMLTYLKYIQKLKTDKILMPDI